MSTRTTIVEVDGRRVEVKVSRPEPPYRTLARRRRERVRHGARGGAADSVVSPMQGTVLALRVAEGEQVDTGAVICIVEAMKMENEVVAHRPGVVTDLSVSEGGAVTIGQAICLIVPVADG